MFHTPATQRTDRICDAVAKQRARRRAEHQRRWRGIWLGCFALFALMFATPITQQVVVGAVSLISHAADDCGDGCEEGNCCPAPCQTCHCCAHTTALTIAPLAMPSLPATSQLIGLHLEALRSSGYVSPPFRPPIA